MLSKGPSMPAPFPCWHSNHSWGEPNHSKSFTDIWMDTWEQLPPIPNYEKNLTKSIVKMHFQCLDNIKEATEQTFAHVALMGLGLLGQIFQATQASACHSVLHRSQQVNVWWGTQVLCFNWSCKLHMKPQSSGVPSQDEEWSTGSITWWHHQTGRAVSHTRYLYLL